MSDFISIVNHAWTGFEANISNIQLSGRFVKSWWWIIYDNDDHVVDADADGDDEDDDNNDADADDDAVDDADAADDAEAADDDAVDDADAADDAEAADDAADNDDHKSWWWCWCWKCTWWWWWWWCWGWWRLHICWQLALQELKTLIIKVQPWTMMHSLYNSLCQLPY